MSYNAQFVSALKEALNGLRTIHSVGEEWCSYIGQIPVGGVPYCGQEVTRSTYSALWSYAQAQGLVKSESEWQSIASAQGGNVPYYSSGNGSSTFRMPRLVGYVKGASGQSDAGAYVKEGLPNLQGWFSLGQNAGKVPGADGVLFEFERQDRAYAASTNLNDSLITHFDASRYDSIYGNSVHVTPETSCVLFGVYAFGEVGNVDALDAGTLASALARVESNLNTKLEKTTTHVVEAWKSSDGSSWYRKWSNGFIEQGGRLLQGEGETITFPVAFPDTEYHFVCSPICNTTDAGIASVQEHRKLRTTTTTRVTCRWGGYSNTGVGVTWEAKGYYQ